MKNINNYKEFLKESISNLPTEYKGRYLELLPTENGLKVVLTPEGKEELELADEDKIRTQDLMSELFEDIQGNSEWLFHSDLGESGFGMTNAPGISHGFIYEDGKYEEYGDCCEVYYDNDYAINNFLEELLEKGEVFLNKA
jgi:hypothetical protein